MSHDQKSLRLVICQEWIEYERGWGCRPDGCSLHLSEADRQAFCAAYWAKMPPKIGGRAPDEYSTENGSPYVAVVSAELYASLQDSKAKHGLWLLQAEMRGGGVRKATPDEIISVRL